MFLKLLYVRMLFLIACFQEFLRIDFSRRSCKWRMRNRSMLRLELLLLLQLLGVLLTKNRRFWNVFSKFDSFFPCRYLFRSLNHSDLALFLLAAKNLRIYLLDIFCKFNAFLCLFFFERPIFISNIWSKPSNFIILAFLKVLILI